MRVIKEIRVENFANLADSLGRDVIARKIGFDDKNYINQLYRGHGSFGDGTARKIEERLGLEIGWLDNVHRNEGREDSQRPGISDVRGQYALRQRSVPLISWTDLALYHESAAIRSAAVDWFNSPFPHSDLAVVLPVIGDSNFPDFREGELVLLDPSIEPVHLDFIVVVKPDGFGAIRMYQETPEGIYLAATNPTHPDRKSSLTQDHNIIGVIRGSWISRLQPRPRD